MILHLKNGQLHPAPTDAALTRKRAMRLAAECARIEGQLKDVTRQAPTFDAWRHKAQQALRLHNMELRLLNEWLESHSAGMLRKARDLFVTLVEDDCDFDEHEKKFIDELKRFVDSAGNSVGV
jgi:hypothetical protein